MQIYSYDDAYIIEKGETNLSPINIILVINNNYKIKRDIAEEIQKSISNCSRLRKVSSVNIVTIYPAVISNLMMWPDVYNFLINIEPIDRYIYLDCETLSYVFENVETLCSSSYEDDTHIIYISSFHPHFSDELQELLIKYKDNKNVTYIYPYKLGDIQYEILKKISDNSVNTVLTNQNEIFDSEFIKESLLDVSYYNKCKILSNKFTIEGNKINHERILDYKSVDIIFNQENKYKSMVNQDSK
mgnify:FL=1